MDKRDQTRQKIQEVVKKIVAEYSPEKVVLFGSYAYGQPDESSDVDLLIIKDTPKRPIERWTEVKRMLRDRQRTFSVSPLVYTPKELEERLAVKDFFIQEVLERAAFVAPGEEMIRNLFIFYAPLSCQALFPSG